MIEKTCNHAGPTLIVELVALPFVLTGYFLSEAKHISGAEIPHRDHIRVGLCPNCARQGQIFPNSSKRNQKQAEKLE
jgi:hypothetical protein